MPASLENSHLADLHSLAAELGVERYRLLPRAELVAAIQERDPDAVVTPSEPVDDAPASEEQDRPRRRERGEGGGRNRRGGGRERRPNRERPPRDDSRDDDEGTDDEDSDDPGEPVKGVLDITPRGHGFIRLGGLESSEDDVYVSPSQIRRCEMRRGDEVAGPARKPRRGERYPALVHVDTINGVEPGDDRVRLADATPVHPSRRIELAPAEGASAEDALLLRTVDLLNPLAFGQRVLVRASAGSGRTTLLRALAGSLAARDDLELVVLLIDERPEEVAAWQEAAPGADLAIASAEMRSGEQLRMVELAFGRASRRAEAGEDVVLIVDSLSRIAIAADEPGRVKPIFGAGRETEEEGTGSLTVIATVLADEEDEGDIGRAVDTTENSLIVLDRDLAAAGIYPAIDAAAGRVSGEEHVRSEDELAAARTLRLALAELSAADAAAQLRERIEGSADNAALLSSLTE
jgi:transcription termination factor Rho